eukprot:1804805-Rhodomonas_salina.5
MVPDSPGLYGEQEQQNTLSQYQTSRTERNLSPFRCEYHFQCNLYEDCGLMSLISRSSRRVYRAAVGTARGSTEE